jgi:isoquinoline 1-oxidoreductase beta subunit
LVVEWDHGAASGFSSSAVMDQLLKALDQAKGFAYYSAGDVDTAMRDAASTITADYQAPYLAHATMEPINCTVQFKDGSADVWV